MFFYVFLKKSAYDQRGIGNSVVASITFHDHLTMFNIFGYLYQPAFSMRVPWLPPTRLLQHGSGFSYTSDLQSWSRGTMPHAFRYISQTKIRVIMLISTSIPIRVPWSPSTRLLRNNANSCIVFFDFTVLRKFSDILQSVGKCHHQ